MLSVAFNDRCLCAFRGEDGDKVLENDESGLRDRDVEGEDEVEVEVEVEESERPEFVLDCLFDGHRSLIPLLDSRRWFGEELVLPILDYVFPLSFG